MKNMSKKISKNHKGFTLVELLMVMGILGLLMIVLFQVFGSILDLKIRSEATTSVAQDSRYVLTRLTYDIARADSITVPSESVTDNTLELVVEGVTHVYTLDGNTLKLSVDGGSSESLNGISTLITSLSFTRFADIDGLSSVQINLGIKPTTIQPGGASGERTLITTVATR